MIPFFFIFRDFVLLFLRLGLGIIFISRGWLKIKDIKITVKNFNAKDFKLRIVWETAIAVLEFFGGLFLIFGLLSQPIALLLAIQMFVATLEKIIKGGKGGRLPGGYELDLLLALSALTLAGSGGGFYSLEGLFGLWLF